MKQYDHEPTIFELTLQLKEEYAYIPDFMHAEALPGNIKEAILDNMVTNFINNFI